MEAQDFINHSDSGLENRPHEFLPAFLDTQTGSIYLSRYKDGRPAPMHLLEGLPRELVVNRPNFRGITEVKTSVIAGFVCLGSFYTRDQAARVIGPRKH